jgi:hypothetical protein
MSPDTTLPTPDLSQSDFYEARRQQKIIDAKITLAEDEISALRQQRKEIEKTLWVEIKRHELQAVLKSYKSLSVRSYSDPYTYDSWASLNAAGELLIGGFHNHDHFRREIYVRRDFDRYTG